MGSATSKLKTIRKPAELIAEIEKHGAIMGEAGRVGFSAKVRHPEAWKAVEETKRALAAEIEAAKPPDYRAQNKRTVDVLRQQDKDRRAQNKRTVDILRQQDKIVGDYLKKIGGEVDAFGNVIYKSSKRVDAYGNVIDLAARKTREASDKTESQGGFGAGEGLRRVTAKLTTGALGGGVLAQAIGGVVGILSGSVLLRIGWMIGNAILNLPQTIGDVVGWQRHTEQLGARAADVSSAAEWRDAAALAREFWGNKRNAEGENMGKVALNAMLGAQGFGPQIKIGDTETDVAMAKRTPAYVSQGELLEMGGYVKSDAYTRMMTQLDSRAGVDAARKELLSMPWLQEAWINQNAKGMPVAQAKARMQLSLEMPQDTLDRLRERTGVISDTSAEYIKNLAQETITTNPRLIGLLEQQEKQWRFEPRTGNWFFRDDTMLKGSEEEWVQMRKRELQQDPNSKPKREYSETRGAYPAISTVTGTAEANRIAILEKIARGEAGQWQEVTGLGHVKPMKAESIMTGEAQWTSFSGLAEQMQTMWSGIPMEAATNNNTTALDTATQSINNLESTFRGLSDVLSGRMGILPAGSSGVIHP